jgi:AAT family amino acid transporter
MTVPKQPAAPEADTQGLQRKLTGRQLRMIGLGGAIGTGLFLGSGLAISQAGPSTIIAYVVCGLVALVMAWALAEMSVVHPTAGAFGVLAHAYIGRWAGFVVRWTYWTVICVTIGGEVVAAGIYVRFWWPEIPLWLTTIMFSVALLAVNASAVKNFGKVEYWFSMIKVSAIIAFILLGLTLVIFGLPSQPAVGLGTMVSNGGFMPHGIQGLLLAMVFAIFSFLGVEMVSVTAAESENPGRDVVSATRSMAFRLALFYVISIAIVLSVVSWTVTAQVGSDITASPFVLVLSQAGIPAAAAIMNFVVLTATLSAANAGLYATARMMHSLAAHRYAPQWTGKLSKSGAPIRALMVSSLGLLLAAIISVIAAESAYLVLFGISVFGALVVWILILVTHMRFRFVRSRRNLPASPARLRGAPVTSVLAALFIAAVLVSTGFIDGLTWAWMAGVPFFGLLLGAYFYVDKRTKAGGERYDPLAEEIRHAHASRSSDNVTPMI